MQKKKKKNKKSKNKLCTKNFHFSKEEEETKNNMFHSKRRTNVKETEKKGVELSWGENIKTVFVFKIHLFFFFHFISY